MPFLLLLYVLAFLDRVNIGYAKPAFLRDTGLGEGAYAFGAGVFFVAYALLEIPSNLMLHRVGARVWIASIMMAWGVVSAATMFARSSETFFILRFLLGAAEAGFFPGMILYQSRWFPARNRAAMFGVFYFGAPLAQILGGPLSGLLLGMNGRSGLKGWQWMFLGEGFLAFLAGAWSLRRLTERPGAAEWLSPEERLSLQSAIDAEEAGKLPAAGANRLWRNPRVWSLGLIYALIQMSTYGVTFYLPSQVSRLLGRDVGFVVGVVSAVPWICGLAAAWAVPRIAGRTGRGAAAGCAMAGAALGIAASATASPALGLLALCAAVAGFIGAQPVFWTFPTEEWGGREAAGGIALVNSLGAVGAFLAPNLKVLAEAAWHSAFAGSLALAIPTAAGAALLFRIGRRRAA
jgi:MFS family permease